MLPIKARSRGFTLIELLIVVAIIGIIAAILIPNLLSAVQKGRQKRTMALLREFGLGMAQYWTENNGAAAAGAATIDIADWTGAATFAEIEDVLVPTYMPQIQAEDGWKNTLDIHVQVVNPPASGFALVRSAGANGVFEGDTYTSGVFVPGDFDQDIVWADGTFVRAPTPAAAGS